MILLITPSARGQECAIAIEVAVVQPTQIATTLSDAIACLRSGEYSAVVFDQCVLDANPDQGNVAIQHVGTAVPVYVNCAINGTDRIVREVRAALQRRQTEGVITRKAVEQAVRSALREPLTAMLLNCELVLSLPNLPAAARERIHAVLEQARQMEAQLAIA
jgi:hypothetical protein